MCVPVPQFQARAQQAEAAGQVFSFPVLFRVSCMAHISGFCGGVCHGFWLVGMCRCLFVTVLFLLLTFKCVTHLSVL